MPIPSGISQILLPKSDLNILDLSHFSIPSSPNIPLGSSGLLTYPDAELFSNRASMVGESHVAFLQSLPMPSSREVETLEGRFVTHMKSNSIHSILYRRDTVDIRLPLWVLEYWKIANEVREEKLLWEPAIEWLRKKKHFEAIGLLGQFPWTYQLPRAMGDHVSDLALLCSERWLKDVHIDSMLEVLKDQLESGGIQASIQGVQFMWKLILTYRHSRDEYAEAPSCRFIRECADKLKTTKGLVFGTAVGVLVGGDDVLLPRGDDDRSNHWCAVVINPDQLTIQYGDPMGNAPPSELLDVIHWWLGLSFNTTFSLLNLPVTRQKDSISCAILTINALSHHFIPTIPLLHNGEPCILGRIDAFVGIIKLLKKLVSSVYYSVFENKLTNLKKDSSMTVSNSNTQIYSSMASASTFVPKNNIKHDEAKRKARVEKVAEKKKEEKEDRGKGKGKVVGHTSAFFLPNSVKKPSPTQSINPKPIPTIDIAPDFSLLAEHNNNDCASGGPGSENLNEVNDDSEDGDGSPLVNPACLIDIETKSANNSKNGGRPTHSLLNDLVQKCYNTEKPEKHIFRCKGGCGKTFSNRNGARIIRHATGCHRLPAGPRKQAKAEAASKAPSRQLNIDDPESTKTISETSDVEGKGDNGPGGVIVTKKRKLEVVEVGGVTVKAKVQKTASSSPFFEKAKALGRKDRHLKLDLAIVKLYCCSGIPTYISDLEVWKEFVNLADPTYSPASRAKLEEIQIIGEAESIQQIQTTYLRTKENLTVSCDGGTAIGGASFFTVHMSTEDRKVYLMEVREATAESHTAVWIKNLVLEVRLQVQFV